MLERADRDPGGYAEHEPDHSDDDPRLFRLEDVGEHVADGEELREHAQVGIDPLPSTHALGEGKTTRGTHCTTGRRPTARINKLIPKKVELKKKTSDYDESLTKIALVFRRIQFNGEIKKNIKSLVDFWKHILHT